MEFGKNAEVEVDSEAVFADIAESEVEVLEVDAGERILARVLHAL